MLRSKTVPFPKIICQETGGKLHLCKAAQVVSARDIKYHLPCYVKLQRRGLTSNNDKVDENKIQEIEDCWEIAADLELINIVSHKLPCPSKIVLNTNTIQELYIKLLVDHGITITQNKHKYKKYIKNLLGELIRNIEFIKPKRYNEPCKTTISRALESAIAANNTDDMKRFFAVSKVIRKHVLKIDQWKFTGSFQNVQRPKTLNTRTMDNTWI